MNTLLRILLVGVVYLLWRRLVGGMASGRQRVGAQRGPAWLVKDPVCNTYIAQERALTLRLGAQTLYFCSEDCRKKHLACTA